MYLKLQKNKQQGFIQVANPKLATRYCGPFRVLECIGEVAYKLELPQDSSVHPYFHVSILKKHIGPADNVTSSLPLLDAHGGLRTEPENILQRRMSALNC